MPSFDDIEYEYRELQARVTYAEFEGDARAEDIVRLDQLAQWRVELTAPQLPR